jgi:hypothetical protein
MKKQIRDVYINFIKMKKTIYFILLIVATSCSQNDGKYLSESDIQDLGRYALGSDNINADLYQYIVDKRVNGQKEKDSLLINDIIEITNILDTLADGYLSLSSGRVENGVSTGALNHGSAGYRLYNKVIDKERLRELLSNLEKYSDESNKKKIDRLKYVINYHFLNENAYFNKEKLEERPYAILSFEVSFIQNGIYVLLLPLIEKK